MRKPNCDSLNCSESWGKRSPESYGSEQQKLMSVDQIPELAGDSLEFIWDFAEIDGENYQIIQTGNVEIWRELAFFENIDRFNEVKELLRRKYGPRVNALTPSRESLEWLCGDNAGKLFQLSYT
jgi:hypothetical protein